jgi:CMP-N,N'-diacetyllegionaminic acid synthase
VTAQAHVPGVLIVVPARGGSKGLPRKNARTLGDLPLLGWTMEAVRAAGLGEAHCVLSTDDPEIAEIGRSVGLDVPFVRPPELATDEASAEAVALHALDWMALNRGVNASAVMWLQPTSPFRTPAALSDAVAVTAHAGFTGAVGVKPVYRSLRTLFRMNEDGDLSAVDASAEDAGRRQAVEPLLTPNGALYLVPAASLRHSGRFVSPRFRGIVMDQVASLDIDDALDWAIAEALAAAGLTWRGASSR